jgi:hypothetical protein
MRSEKEKMLAIDEKSYMNQRKSDILSGELLSFSTMFTKLGCHLILAKGEFLDSLN